METMKGKQLVMIITPTFRPIPFPPIFSEDLHFINSSKMIKTYACSERKDLTEKGRKSE